MELMRRQIPFVVRSGLRFFEQAHIKDILSYLRYLYNPSDELSFRRAIRQHQGIGPLLSQKLWQQKDDLGAAVVGPKAKLGVSCFLTLIDKLKRVQSPGAMIRTLLDDFYQDYAHAQFTNGQQRCDDIKQLAHYAETFVSMQKFLSELMLLSELGVEELPANADPAKADLRKVTLSSIHQAKGLEWSQVFVAWMVEGRFPSELALREPDGVEEERRLFYVAATRAKDQLYLVHPQMARQSDWRQVLLRRSRFVEETLQHAESWVVEEEVKNAQL